MATTFAVPDGRVAMAATTYTGNGSTQSISNAVNTVSFQPDLVWIKNRTSSYNHVLQDSIRGATAAAKLSSNLADAEGGANLAPYGNVSAFNSNGFSLAAGSIDSRQTNTGSESFIGWQWKAGTSTVTNNSGTLSSQVNANTTTGFSIVTWTGTGSGATSVGHGLPVLPQLVFVKKRNVAENWYVGAYANQGLNYAYHLFLNTNGANSGNNDPYVLGSQTSLTSNVLQLADGISGNGGNQTGTNYVAYCWAPVAGYSAFGSYTGNGSADGPFIYTGFRPRFVLIKQFSGTPGAQVNCLWSLTDTSVNPYNFATNTLMADSGTAPFTYATGILDILSNGFKLRNAGFDFCNNSACSYIYAAFAENPLCYSNAR